MVSFIGFEGVDGAGKTTQLKLLEENFRNTQKTREIICTREPFDEAIRNLLHSNATNYSPLVQLFLLSASRTHHRQALIEPALKRNALVLTDRWTFSTLAYQGYGLGLNKNIINDYNNVSTNGISPDINFIIDIDIATMFERIKARGIEMSSYENLGQDFFKRVRAGYLEIAAGDSQSFHVIDGNDRTQKQIAAQINEIIKGYL